MCVYTYIYIYTLTVVDSKNQRLWLQFGSFQEQNIGTRRDPRKKIAPLMQEDGCWQPAMLFLSELANKEGRWETIVMKQPAASVETNVGFCFTIENCMSYSVYIYRLVGGLEHFLCFHIYWEFHHPNWRTHIFQRGWNTNHQPVIDGFIAHRATDCNITAGPFQWGAWGCKHQEIYS